MNPSHFDIQRDVIQQIFLIAHFVFHRGEIPSMQNVQNVLLHSIHSLILIFTAPSLMGHYHSPGVHMSPVYATNI